MARQVTLEKRYLRTKLIKARKNLSKIKSHIKYLEECQVKKVIPRSLNLVNLAKSEELWKGNKKHKLVRRNNHKVEKGRAFSEKNKLKRLKTHSKKSLVNMNMYE